MDISQECVAIERRLKSAGKTVEQMCAEAGIDRSTWTRWKSGKRTPRLTAWQCVLDAVPPEAAA